MAAFFFFFKINCNKKYETTWVNTSYSITWKSLNLACSLNSCFTPLHGFVTSFIGHLENTALLSNADLQNCWHISSYNIRNSFVNVIAALSESPLSIGDLMCAGDGYKFFRIQIFISNFDTFFLITNDVSYILDVHFWKIVCQIPKSQ